jgi:hypothetical protein
LSEVYLLGPQRRQPRVGNDEQKGGREWHVWTYSADSDCDGLGLKVIVKGNKEPWIHGWNQEVKHPVILVEHDYSEGNVNPQYPRTG